MELDFLLNIVLVLGLATVVLFILQKLRFHLIIGFLLTGVLAGPHVLGIFNNVEDIEMLAEIGVILLLFAIGIEFSLKSLLRIGRILLIGGSFQVLVTILVIAFISYRLNFPLRESVFVGFLIALSSTAIVLKVLQDKGELEAAHGRIALGILIFQDIIIVPLMLVTPILAGNQEIVGGSYLEIALKVLIVVVLIILGARYVVPWILHQVARTQSRELFILSIIVLAFAVAFMTHSIGLSLALGAFLAGLVVSESQYSQQALGNITPFLDVFTSFFFISIGMLLNIEFFAENWIRILIFATIVLSVKTFIAGSAAFILGYPLRTVIITGFTLSQVGEFSFILSEIGIEEGVLSESTYQLFLSVSILSMAATPMVIKLATRAANLLVKRPLPGILKYGWRPMPESTFGKIRDHLVIVGYGLNGQNVARAAKHANVAYVIIEINPDTVRRERTKGNIIYFGDATQSEVLSHANVEEAMILVVTAASVSDSKKIVQVARRMNPRIHIIVRTRFIQDMEDLYSAGADEVVPEEFETSVEIFTRVLSRYLVPRNEINKLVAEVRSDGYKLFRRSENDEAPFKATPVNIPDVEISGLHVCRNSEAMGMKVSDLRLEQDYDLTLLAISRGQKVIRPPYRNIRLEENDILFFLGHTDQVARIEKKFSSREEGVPCNE